MSSKIIYPSPKGSRQGIKHTEHNRPDCAHPDCAKNSPTGKVRKAQNQLGNGEFSWRPYIVKGMAIGGLCSACNKKKTPGMSSKNVKKKQNEAVRRGFVKTKGMPDVRAMNAYDLEEKYKTECAELSSFWGITIDLETYKLNRTSIHRICVKNHCENENTKVIKHLDGIKCNYSDTWLPLVRQGVITKAEYFSNLEVDHIDGDSSHEHPSNYQTLCSHCHKIKTYRNGDHLSEGRLTIKKKKMVS